MAPFSFIKTSTLIFAYLFLWYQTNYQHQVSALSTLKDDDISDGSGLYSSEEDINNGNVGLKTAQGNGTNVSSVEYGECRPPQGGVGSSAHSAEKNTPREEKNIKDKFQKICKKIFCRRSMKHRCIQLLILGILILCVIVIPGVASLAMNSTGSTGFSAVKIIGLGVAAVIILGLLILVGYLEILYCRARDKYFEKKENNNILKYSKKKKKEQNNKIKNKLTSFFLKIQ
ncbi:hypothetical protein, conserved in P.knowlesi [Plasmodium knowlesi strain H]|uniref:Uncharacterized protein n=3 Tax=Plasmodium knowlesi TaxID=5850 RepID=A0A5K1VQY2_PLAKH|nr:uncharacterized protein PKNH_0407000 [Plasmodium knowlesi strain H]OTN66786.1 Uncharacterized protein PKNOH_S08502100 [Plasmodium knowlesi]CAA9986710.1 hypothetical protein, conserved in P.knowlesi [Plasmodium knowlesi strain H]SBO23524.1 hypothetical protein, conserved in P.knowlesi [Plasmodium knowlesi strain H]SBO25029.1 hypothetical protein, conserved in P.knowlesi [Plasmodium knowlesi strain H]VVS76184.1 hypothetical protein, conserved in P.knowlesi [Plasmodium knowlesi strain H]|eukprot:XP_002257895.1 [Plasmodium knowlesi strain H]